jgi:hypothetical protein
MIGRYQWNMLAKNYQQEQKDHFQKQLYSNFHPKKPHSSTYFRYQLNMLADHSLP